MYATVFDGILTSTGEHEIRVFLNDTNFTQYVGALSDQLQLPGVNTIFINLGQERCIIGWVSPNTQGNLLYFLVDRLEPDRSKWMDAELESTITKNVFIIPIRSGDNPASWDFIARAGVQTKESLQRSYDGKGDSYQLDQVFSPPLDVSSFYILVKVQK